MLWYGLFWVATLLFAYTLGYSHREIREEVMSLKRLIESMGKNIQKTKAVEVKKRPTIIDADDVVTQVRMEHAEKMRQLNPDKDD